MKRKKLVIAISILGIAAVLIGSVVINNRSKNGEINLLGYKEAEEVNANGYQITKFENVRSAEWIDNDNVIIFNGESENLGNNIYKGDISKYDLNSKEKRDYADANVDDRALHGISPSGRYLLYGEPRDLLCGYAPEEWDKAVNDPNYLHQKRNILDLETGEIIRDFDKISNNCSAFYKWIKNDFIFIDYGGEWAILDKSGKWLKRGTFKFNDTADTYTYLVDVDEIEVSDEGFSGSFYYMKDFRRNNGSVESRLFSMDVNTLEEKMVYSSDYASDFIKHGDVINFQYIEDNGDCRNKDADFQRIFAFKDVNKDGTVLQDFRFPAERNFKELTLSPSGNKCAFIEVDSNAVYTKVSEENKLNNVLKVMDIKTGEVKEIAKVEDLMDKDNEEEFIYHGSYTDENGEVREIKDPGPVISNIKWNKTGDSLTFNYKYTSKNDKNTYTNTYVVTFYR